MTPRQRFLLVRAAYVVIVLLGTLTRLDASADLHAAHERLVRAVLPSLGWRDAVDGLRNVVLFAGLGAVWVVTSLTGRARREAGRVAIVSLLLSTTIEALQIFSPIRNASIIDIATNTLGGLGGAVATIALLAAVQRRRRAKSYLGIPMLLVAGPYAVSALCEALAPLFHSAPLPFLQGGPLSRLRLALDAALPLAATEIPIIDVALFAAAGFLLVALRRERRGATRADWLFVGVPAAVVVTGAHVIHGAFGLAVRWEALATDAVALVIGAWVASRWLPSITRNYRGAARARLCMLAYTLLLVLWGWRPLVPKTQLAAIAAQINVASLTPLQSLAERVDVFSALHVAQQFLLYVPLGALLAVWPLRRSGRLSGVRPAVWLAGVIEIGHIVMAGRTFDVTNFLLALAGLAIGWIAVRRCGYEPHGTVASVGFPADSVRRDPQARAE